MKRPHRLLHYSTRFRFFDEVYHIIFNISFRLLFTQVQIKGTTKYALMLLPLEIEQSQLVITNISEKKVLLSIAARQAFETRCIYH